MKASNIFYKGISLFLIILLLFHTTACKIYKQNIMFRTDFEIWDAIQKAEQNYTVQVNDIIQIQLFTNDGEVLIDPMPDANTGGGGGMNMGGGMAMVGGNNLQNGYLVQPNGYANLPLLGATKVVNYTLNELDSLLAEKYSEFYQSPFVKTIYLNKRVIVFKGISGNVIPLNNEGMNLLEVLAMAGGVNNNERATNIRLIRGDLKNPEVQIINLSTIDGMRRADLQMQPNDIVYIEPIRKTFLETLGDISPILSFVTTIFTFIILLQPR